MVAGDIVRVVDSLPAPGMIGCVGVVDNVQHYCNNSGYQWVWVQFPTEPVKRWFLSGSLEVVGHVD